MQLFNAMGVEVRVHEIYRGSRLFVGAEIFELARGKVRLDELGAIARARVRVLEAEGRLHPEYDASGKRVYTLTAVAGRSATLMRLRSTWPTPLNGRKGCICPGSHPR